LTVIPASACVTAQHSDFPGLTNQTVRIDDLIDWSKESEQKATLDIKNYSVYTPESSHQTFDFDIPSILHSTVNWVDSDSNQHEFDDSSCSRQPGTLASVPEPGSLALIGLGLIGLGTFKVRR
jgi:hypothetical protein